MRIAFATDTCLPEVNGVTTVLATMRDGLLERGHEVLVLAPAYPADTRTRRAEDGVIRRPSVRCPGYGTVRLSWPADPAVTAALERFRPDVVHAVTEGPLGLQGRRFALRHRLPLVTSFHTDFPAYAERYLGRWAVGPTTRWLRWFHGAAAFTQTPSDVTRRRLLDLGIPRPVVWGRSVDSRRFHPGLRTAVGREATGTADRVVVLHVGRLAVEKDVDTLIGAFTGAHAVLGSAAEFCVAGDGPEGPRVRQALPFARHLGFLSRPELALLYANADLFVFPSPTETCGLVALEAMASGLPVIGAATGGILESVTPGITGRLVPAGDVGGFVRAIVELVHDHHQRSAMGVAARAFAVGRDWQVELDALVPAYAGLLGHAAPPSAAPALAATRAWSTPVGIGTGELPRG